MFKQTSSLKTARNIFLKLMVLSLLGVWSLSFDVSHAQERGIGVSPAKINIDQNVEWPYTVPIIVTNFSEQQEQFEVFGAQANPGRFMLEAGASRRVMVTFDESGEGEVKVLSMRMSEEGLNTGTGVKIPFRVAEANDSRFLAGAGEASGGFPYIFGTAVLLITIILLWQIAGIIRPWINSSKQ